jgi:hypothetical protein
MSRAAPIGVHVVDGVTLDTRPTGCQPYSSIAIAPTAWV